MCSALLYCRLQRSGIFVYRMCGPRIHVHTLIFVIIIWLLIFKIYVSLGSLQLAVSSSFTHSLTHTHTHKSFPVFPSLRFFYYPINHCRVGLGIVFLFFLYRCQIDTFKMVPVPKRCLFFFYQLIIGLAISTKHMGPVSQTHRQGLD